MDSVLERAKKLVNVLRRYASKYRNGSTLGRAIEDTEDVMDDAANLIDALRAELERVTKERDAAVADLKHADNCDICEYNIGAPDGCDFGCDICTLDCVCAICRNEDRWEWRGAEVAE